MPPADTPAVQTSMESALRRSQRWAFLACSCIGIPALLLKEVFRIIQAGEVIAPSGTSVVFLAGLLATAFAINRCTASGTGLLLTIWMGAVGFTEELGGGLQMGMAAGWFAAAFTSQLYVGMRLTLATTGAMFLLLLGHSTLVARGVLSNPPGAFPLPAALPSVAQGALPLSAAMIGIAMAIRGFLRTLAESYRQTQKLQEESQAADARRRAAEQAMEAQHHFDVLGRVAAGVAHDVNNALTVVLGTAELLRQPSSESERLSCIEDLKRAAQGATQTTRQLLSFVPRAVCRPQPVDPGALITQLARSIKRLLPDTITVHCTSSSTRLIFVDPADLQQALLNLAINARDAMPDGGRLDFRVEDVPEVADSIPGVAIHVADTGVGIPAATRDRIFEPFFTTKGPGKGTGLGLSMVRQFADQAGGRVTVRSEPGAGAVFTLTLPECQSRDFNIADTPTPAQGSNERILLVEDRQEVLNVVRRTLERGGYATVAAMDGRAARVLIDADGPFDLLCIDASIPSAGSTEVIAHFQATHPGQPVLLCAGNITDPALNTAIASGEVSVLAKPFTATEILATVSSLLEGTRSATA